MRGIVLGTFFPIRVILYEENESQARAEDFEIGVALRIYVREARKFLSATPNKAGGPEIQVWQWR